MIDKCHSWSEGSNFHLIIYSGRNACEFDIRRPTTQEEVELLDVGFRNIAAWLEDVHKEIGTPYVAPPSP